MIELAELKARISKAGPNGVKTSHIRDDYEPIGQLLINDLVATGEYVTMRIRTGLMESAWFIFQKDQAPYHQEC